MKKTLIALAALAVVSAASAQSTVTLYGLVDVWAGAVTVDNGTNSVTNTKLDSGGVNGSRWGMKGTEDLGGGLKAIFDLQSGFSLDTGAGGQGESNSPTTTTSTLFGRSAWVGLTGGFGSVKFGRISSISYDLAGASNAVFDSALSPSTYTARINDQGTFAKNPIANGLGNTNRLNNSIRYDSNAMSGLVLSGQIGLTENKTATTDAGAIYALGATYTAGPIAAQFSYTTEKPTGAIADAAKFAFLGGSYNFGVATLKANVAKASNIGFVNGAADNEYQIGVDVPVSSALTLSTSYAYAKDNSTASVTNEKRTGLGLGAAYTLSKRTFVYGGLVNVTKTNDGLADATTRVIALGLQHRF